MLEKTDFYRTIKIFPSFFSSKLKSTLELSPSIDSKPGIIPKKTVRQVLINTLPVETPKKTVKRTGKKLLPNREKRTSKAVIALLGESLYLLGELVQWKRFDLTEPKGRKIKNLSGRIRAFLYN